METVSLLIKSRTTDDKSIQTTVPNVNPEATNAQIISLAQALNALTTNVYSGVIKVTKEEIISE